MAASCSDRVLTAASWFDGGVRNVATSAGMCLCKPPRSQSAHITVLVRTFEQSTTTDPCVLRVVFLQYDASVVLAEASEVNVCSKMGYPIAYLSCFAFFRLQTQSRKYYEALKPASLVWT